MFEFEYLLEELETAMDRCHKELLKQSEAMEIYNDFRQRALRIPENDSDEWRTLERRIKEIPTPWWERPSSGYVLKKNCEHFGNLRATLKQLLKENEPKFLRIQKRSKNQMFFASGEEYEAKKAIFDVMKDAIKSLCIADPYLYEVIFEYLGSLDNTIQINLLTGNKKSIFKTLFVPFKSKRGCIEARIYTQFHDRFILLDTSRAVHLGTSINYAGKNAFMINKVTDNNEFKKFVNEFNSWWHKGQSLTHHEHLINLLKDLRVVKSSKEK